MEIKIQFDHGKWRVRPDPAVVKSGEDVRWIVEARNTQPKLLQWILYFQTAAPFRQVPAFLQPTPQEHANYVARLKVTTIARPRPALGFDRHVGVTEAIQPELPGDYKYGIALRDAQSGEDLGDDDPILQVLPFPWHTR